MSGAEAAEPRWISPSSSLEQIDAIIAAPILAPRHTWRWWLTLAVSGGLTLLMIVTVTWLFAHGIGIFGNNTTIVWGFPIANYVWWLGIGHAGTLISALLLLTRQKWRASLNRFAETMTLFAASMAGLFPIFHLGRPYYLYWIIPYPNVQGLWPQWRSALVWDFWAVGTYIIFSALFWYVGLVPDLAMLRDRARRRGVRRLYGAFALGWHGSARHWEVYERFYRYMAALAVPLVVSVHSIVSLDFAASLEPGWADTIYPPYFVVGALYSGFAMVVVIAAVLRWACSFEPFITHRHFDAIAKVLLAASVVMGVSYASEWFWSWYGGERAERHLVTFLFTGPYAPLYYGQLLFNVVAPQALWLPSVRRSIVAVTILSILINVGMWLERILIVWATLSRDYLPSAWRIFLPTFWDWALLFGSLGAFTFLFMIFARVLPALPAHELRKTWVEEKRRVSNLLLAEFASARETFAAARKAAEAGMPATDVLSPHPLEGIIEHLAPPPGKAPIGWVMFAAGSLGALAGYFMQWYSAVIDYPINSGGRGLNSWPAFLLVPYETAILGAAIAGILGWLWMCRLPRLHHPLFAVDAVEGASQDRYLLVFAAHARLGVRIERSLKPQAVYELSR